MIHGVVSTHFLSVLFDQFVSFVFPVLLQAQKSVYFPQKLTFSILLRDGHQNERTEACRF